MVLGCFFKSLFLLFLLLSVSCKPTTTIDLLKPEASSQESNTHNEFETNEIMPQQSNQQPSQTVALIVTDLLPEGTIVATSTTTLPTTTPPTTTTTTAPPTTTTTATTTTTSPDIDCDADLTYKPCSINLKDECNRGYNCASKFECRDLGLLNLAACLPVDTNGLVA